MRDDAPTRSYANVLRTVSESPWAILPAKLAAIQELVELRAAGERFSDEELQARIGAARPSRGGYVTGSVAVIPLYGVLMPRATLFSQISGATSVQDFAQQLQQAVANEQITAILIDVCSPGGLTDLITETAALIRDARARKPVVAIANTDAASAAYWLASQASELVVTPSGLVGSIGVFAAHTDISAAEQKLGVKTTLISAGKYKTEGNPYEPLSQDAHDAIQRIVSQTYDLFLADVAKGRKTSADAVEAGYGQGRMLTPADALAAGMVDRVATFDETFQRLAHPPARARIAAISADELRAAYRLALQDPDLDEPEDDDLVEELEEELDEQRDDGQDGDKDADGATKRPMRRELPGAAAPTDDSKPQGVMSTTRAKSQALYETLIRHKEH